MKYSFIFSSFLIIGRLFGQEEFSFVFLPDLHLQPDSAVEARFDSVVAQVNELDPDFILMGGDMIYTAKNLDNIKAEMLFDYMDSNFSKFEAPLKYAFGNHELVGVLGASGLDTSHPMWGKNMYEERYGKTYYSFDFKGWKFIVLDGILINVESRNYSEGVDTTQNNWLKNELELTDFNTPICIVIHTPLADPRSILNPGSNPIISESSNKVLGLFDSHNLKLVLQGHIHAYMSLEVGGILYCSGGSTSNSKPLDYFNDGFILVEISENDLKTEFFHIEHVERTIHKKCTYH